MSMIKAVIERIERLHLEKKEIEEDLKEVYAEAKANGLDTKALREAVKIRAKDPDAHSEHVAIVGLYLAECGMPVATHARVARVSSMPAGGATQ